MSDRLSGSGDAPAVTVPFGASPDRVAALLASEYGISAALSSLAGENINYTVTAEDGRRFVLKVAGSRQSPELIDLEHEAVCHALAAGLAVDLPRIVPTRARKLIATHADPDEPVLQARLYEVLSGSSWCDVEEASTGQLRDLGHTLGTLDRALEDFSHPAASRTHRWDLSAAAQHRAKVALIDDHARRGILESAFHLYAACAAPRLEALPASVIHGDANDENVLVESGRVAGLLDFGDCLHNPTVCELAIALAYAMLDRTEPLQAGAEVVAGYHAARPLTQEELDVLYPLTCGRLAVTVVVAAERRRIDPDHARWFVTEERAWQLLERLSSVEPAQGTMALASGIDHDVVAVGSSVEALLEQRARHIGPSLSIAYHDPIKMVRGAGQYLYDDRGQPYLDLVNNVCHVGHCHPRVVEAGQQQMARLNTNTRYLYDGLTDYAERLCATLPASLNTCFFVNSGTEANELALRLAAAHTGRHDLLVVDGAYHGHTAKLIAASPYKFMGPGGAGAAEPWAHVVPTPDGYRGLHRGQGREVGEAYGDEVGRVIDENGVSISAFLAESLLSCGGQIIPPEGYFETAFDHVRAAGGLCILDEVQVGFGRVGSHFWAFEMQDVVPDVVVLGKPMGSGHPMGAAITTAEIAASFDSGMEFFSTFGGNPVSCAIGLAVLDVIRDEALQQHALETGTRMLDGLRGLMEKHPLIGDVRGAGLFVGVELVRDRSTLEPAAEEANALVNRMRDRGVLLSTDGPFDNVIKIKPPLVLTADDVDMAVRVLRDELGALEAS